jgi:lysophospholipase L1-like esterase
LTAVAGLALALSGVGLTASSANAESLGGVRIMPLGDSITDGLDVPSGYRYSLWRRLVVAGYRNDFVGSQSNGPGKLPDHDYEGHPGWRIDEVDANIAGWLRTSKPHSVLLHIGTNDVLNANASTAPDRLSTLIDHITETRPSTEVFVATIIPMGWADGDAAVRSFNSAIPAIVKSKARNGKHVHLVDMHSALSAADLGSDGVHPNAGGYQKMAAVWYRTLRSVPGAAGTRDNPRWVSHRAN